MGDRGPLPAHGVPAAPGNGRSGLVTCHWHHARFDLESGCTLDPFADDARAFDVDVAGREVVVARRVDDDPIGPPPAAPRRRPRGRHHAGDRQVRARPARRRRRDRRDRAAQVSSSGSRYRDRGLGRRTHRAGGDGERAARRSTTTTGALALVHGLRSSPATPRAARRASRCARFDGGRTEPPGSPPGTAASSRPARATRAERVLVTALADGRPAGRRRSA